MRDNTEAEIRHIYERFLFGSDAGFGHPYWQTFQLEKIRSLNLSPEEERLVLGGNAERIMAGVSS